jgi:uncharacterized phiE125 gp8 family phage protein
MAFTTTGPTSEPITLAEVKNYLKVSASADDFLIVGLIRAAREIVENYTGRALMVQTVTEFWDAFPCCPCCELELSRYPASALTSLEYKNAAGAYVAVDSASYLLNTAEAPVTVSLKSGYSWASPLAEKNAVKAVYTAGAATAKDVPESLRLAMFLLIGFHYENREDIPINESKNPKVRSAFLLMQPYRVWKT